MGRTPGAPPAGLMSRATVYGWAAILLVGLLLRVPGLTWGLPDEHKLFPYHPDEPTLVELGSRMARTGDLNPHFFNYGSLPVYLSALVLGAVGLSAAPPGDSGPYLALRLVSLVFGLGTIVLAGALAGRLLGKREQWVAAGLVAVTPIHVIGSSYATVDSLATFLLAAAVLCGVRVLDGSRPADYALAGAFAGLAASTKYVGLTAALVPLACAAWRERRWLPSRSSWAGLGIAVACATGAFALTTPYAFIDRSSFWRDFAFELQHKREGGTTVPPGVSGFAYLFGTALPSGLTWPLVVVMVAGLWLALRRRDRSVPLAAWLVWLVIVTGSGREVFVRYTMPLAPFAAVVVAGLCGGLRPGHAGVALGLVAAVGLYALAYSAAYTGMYRRPDVRDAALDHIVAQAENGHPSVGLVQAPWFFSPPIAGLNGGPRTAGVYGEWARERGWEVTITAWDPSRLAVAWPDVFVLSEFEFPQDARLRPTGSTEFVRFLERHYRLSAVLRSDPMLLGIRFPDSHAHDWRYMNPEIRVYRRQTPPTAGALPAPSE